MPGIQRELQASFDQLQWVMNGFVIMLMVFMVAMGRLGDIYGRRRVLFAGVILFALSSFAAGAAPTPDFLIACRFLQGIGGAAALILGAALVGHHFPEAEHGRAMAVFMSITGFGMALGPVLGGFFLTWLSWRWAFYVNVPVVIVGFLIAWRSVRETPPQPGERVDWLGLACLLPGMTSLVTAIMQANDWGWLDPATLSAFVAGLFLLALFVVVERRAVSPTIDFALFKDRYFLAATVVALSLGGFITLGNFVAPLYLQSIRNEVPYAAGFMLLPISGLVVILPPLIGKLADRVGPLMFLSLGQVCLVSAALVQMRFQPDSPLWLVLMGLGLFGLGWGLQQATATVAAAKALPPAAAGVAIGVLYSIWNFGSALGLALGGQIFEETDRQSLYAGLARQNIVLAPADQEVIRSLLSDPSRATTRLGELAPGLEAKVLPLFKQAFMDGYSGAMWYLTITCALGAVLVTLLARGARGPAASAAREGD
jgi:EmrB/QacA subfamily drug resistance transporter